MTPRDLVTAITSLEGRVKGEKIAIQQIHININYIVYNVSGFHYPVMVGVQKHFSSFKIVLV